MFPALVEAEVENPFPHLPIAAPLSAAVAATPEQPASRMAPQMAVAVTARVVDQTSGPELQAEGQAEGLLAVEVEASAAAIADALKVAVELVVVFESVRHATRRLVWHRGQLAVAVVSDSGWAQELADREMHGRTRPDSERTTSFRAPNDQRNAARLSQKSVVSMERPAAPATDRCYQAAMQPATASEQTMTRATASARGLSFSSATTVAHSGLRKNKNNNVIAPRACLRRNHVRNFRDRICFKST